MSELSDYNAAAAQFADTALQQTGSLMQSTFNYKKTKQLAKYQQELNRQDAEYNRNMKLRSYQDAIQAARNAGVSPLAAIGSQPLSSSAQMSDTSITPWTDFKSSSPSFSASAVLSRQLQQMDENIKSTEIANAIQAKNLGEKEGTNMAINDKLKGLGYEVPIDNSTGFLTGLETFDSHLANSSDRNLRRLANSNAEFIENYKQKPEVQSKIMEGYMAELEKSIVSAEDAKVLLKGHKLDNKLSAQKIKIAGVEYQVVKADLYAKWYDNKIIKPLQSAKLEGDVAFSQANAEYMIFRLDRDKQDYNRDKRSSPWYWYDLRDEEFENGEYYEAGKSWFLGGLYMMPDVIGAGLGIKKIGK